MIRMTQHLQLIVTLTMVNLVGDMFAESLTETRLKSAGIPVDL